MDGCSWLLQGSGGGDMRGYTASCGGAGLHHKEEEDQEAVIGSQAMQQQLNQIYMLLEMEEHEYDVPAPPPPPPRRASLPSSSSSSFRSFSGSRDGEDNSSSLVLTAGSTTTTSCHHYHHNPEVSSQIPLSPVSYGAVHRQHSSSGSLDMIPLDSMYYQEPYQEHARCSRSVHGAAAACAFRPYAQCLGPRKKLKPGTCGQRKIKTAMSILERMHTAKLAQCYQMEFMAAQAAPPPPPTPAGTICNQLQHVLAERKRREKLNDSFKALGSVLPPVSKKDKASILIRAKDYVNNLKSRVSELEEKNRMLVESELHGDDGKRDDDSGEKIEVDISRAAAEGPLECQEFHLKIVLMSECGVMDAVAGILRCLKERGDVSSVAMNTDSSTGISRANSFPRSTVTLKLKSSRCDEELLKESVIKAVKDVTQSDKAIA